MPSRNLKHSLFIAVFFLSGVAGLGYQVTWTKSFAAAIGHEYPAMLAVVSAFMGGMTVGNVILDRLRTIGPRCYAWLEILIGAWALVTLLLTPLLQQIVYALLGTNPSPALHWTVVFLTVLAVLFPATAAMGATLPAAERFLFATGRTGATGLLYGSNTAGAMVGVLAGAFWLMPGFGLRVSILILAGVNILCGIFALLLARNANATIPVGPIVSAIPRPLAWRLFLAGLLGIGFEVVLVRALSHVLENTVYTFAVVLAVYLGGTAAGAFIFHRAQSHRIFLKGTWLFGIVAIACALGGLLLRTTPGAYAQMRSSLGDSPGAVALSETLIAALVLLLAAIGTGALWAHLVQSSLNFRTNLARAVAVNTAGAAAAPVLIGLLVVPAFGIQGALGSICAGYALLGGRARTTVLTAFVILIAFPFLTATRDLVDTSGGTIISLKDGAMGSVAVIENSDGSRVLKFNNRFQMGGTAARIAEQRQADIPLLLHPEPKRALFIGLGTGITFASAAHYPGLRADGVELVPEIVAAMPYFDPDEILRTTNLSVHIADGRRFVRATDEKYDVIVADLFHPAQDGAGFLYTREHFQAIHDRLNEGGLFCQWLPLHQMDLATLEIISATFNSVFPGAEQWLLRFNIGIPVVGLIGSKEPAQYHAGTVEELIRKTPRLAAHLSRIGLADSVRLFGCYIGIIPTPADPPPLNTDANPIVIFRAPAITFERQDNPAERLMHVVNSAPANSSGLQWTNSSGPANLRQHLDRFILARNIYLAGLMQESKGNVEGAIKAYIQSAATSRDFTAGYAQALTFASALFKQNPEASRSILEALIRAQPDRPVAREVLNRLEIIRDSDNAPL